MKYLSVCSGIEAASVAWHPLGWQPLAFSEIEPFPRKVLKHHYPDVPCHGDFTKLREMDFIKDADLLVGGTPCQAFSVAGLRQSLDDDRGNLTLEFVRLADAIDNLRPNRPCTIVWENVPGVLSVQDNAFGCFLAALVGNDSPLIPTGGKWTNAGMVVGPQRSAAWRVFDAQYFGVAQRRRRVFVVASARDGFDPAEVLFEREGMRRDTPPSREKGKEPPQLAGTITANGGGLNRPAGNANELDFCIPTERRTGSGKDIFPSLMANVGTKLWLGNQEALSGDYHILEPVCVSDGQPNASFNVGLAPTLNSSCEQPYIVHGTQDPCVSDIAFAQGRNNGGENVLVQPIGFEANMSFSNPSDDDVYHTLTRRHHAAVVQPMHDPSPTLDASYSKGTGERNGVERNVVAQPIAIHPHCIGRSATSGPQGKEYLEDGSAYTMDGRGAAQAVMQPIAYASSDGIVRPLGDVMSTLDSARESRGSAQQRFIHQQMAVRRLTPKECERLQGFPDDYTDIPKAADGPRYKALGNSMAVPVMAWIGKRIDEHVKTIPTKGP
jgi:DNA (cytosine-5)-methyltransferase 1